jgi:hypothetical protein
LGFSPLSLTLTSSASPRASKLTLPAAALPRVGSMFAIARGPCGAAAHAASRQAVAINDKVLDNNFMGSPRTVGAARGLQRRGSL